MNRWKMSLNLGTEDFDVAGLGTTGCFAAMFIGYLSCMAFSKLRRCHKLMLEQYTAGMGGGCVLAIRTLIPLPACRKLTKRQ